MYCLVAFSMSTSPHPTPSRAPANTDFTLSRSPANIKPADTSNASSSGTAVTSKGRFSFVTQPIQREALPLRQLRFNFRLAGRSLPPLRWREVWRGVIFHADGDIAPGDRWQLKVLRAQFIDAQQGVSGADLRQPRLRIGGTDVVVLGDQLLAVKGQQLLADLLGEMRTSLG